MADTSHNITFSKACESVESTTDAELSNKNLTWTLSGQGYTFSNDNITIIGGPAQSIYADETACGMGSVTVMDFCGISAEQSITNIDVGECV